MQCCGRETKNENYYMHINKGSHEGGWQKGLGPMG